MKKNLFNSVIVISVLALCVSCKKHSSTPAASNYKTLNVTTSDRTLYSNFSATIQGYAMPQVELWLSDRSEYPEKGKIDVIRLSKNGRNYKSRSFTDSKELRVFIKLK